LELSAPSAGPPGRGIVSYTKPGTSYLASIVLSPPHPGRACLFLIFRALRTGLLPAVPSGQKLRIEPMAERWINFSVSGK
jgi:hypothetical protein